MAEAGRRYSVLIELYDHTAEPSHPSPIHHSTQTRLPPQLDARLRAAAPRLVLPGSNKDFWSLQLPSSAPLDTLVTSAPTSPPSAPERALSSPRVWSQSSALLSPPAILTAQLWTPSQPPPSASPAAAPSGQQARLDYRFGPLALDWIDSPSPAPSRAPLMSPSLSSTSLPAPGPSDPVQWNPTSPRPATIQLQPKPRSPPRSPETSGRTELNWGVIHLFRESGAAPEDSSEKDKSKAANEDDGTVVGMVSVPGVLTAAAILTFISPALESIAQLRLLRDSTPNRTIVLLRFYEAADASLFLKMYNGRSYHDNKDSEVAQVVPISSIQLKSSSNPPFTFPYPPGIEETGQPHDLVELPTCPICLERLDAQVSGLVQILCQHSYHCSCLLKWGDSRCPVCRSTNARARKGTISAGQPPPQAVVSTCAVCQSDSNLWICVICGNVGCGRYQGGHAHSHFDESGHSYALEIETGRVWSYLDDEYVHRLIRNRTDGKLVELPSLFNDDEEGKKKKPMKDDESSVGGPDHSDEASQDKLEAMGLEYANLMTTQLESQRGYYEEEIARAKEDGALWRRKWEALSEEAERGKRDGKELKQRVEELSAELAKGKEEWRIAEEKRERIAREEDARRKKEKQEAAKSRKELERELEQEKSVTASLSTNLGLLRADFGKREAETEQVRVEVEDLKEQMRDLMFALSARDQIEAAGGEAAGGDVVVPPTPPPTTSARRKKKK